MITDGIIGALEALVLLGDGIIGATVVTTTGAGVATGTVGTDGTDGDMEDSTTGAGADTVVMAIMATHGVPLTATAIITTTIEIMPTTQEDEGITIEILLRAIVQERHLEEGRT